MAGVEDAGGVLEAPGARGLRVARDVQSGKGVLPSQYTPPMCPSCSTSIASRRTGAAPVVQAGHFFAPLTVLSYLAAAAFSHAWTSNGFPLATVPAAFT